MNRTITALQLLIVAIQDLHEGERAWTGRLSGLAQAVGADLGIFIAAQRERAARQVVRLETLAGRFGAAASDARNIWLNAVLDDAERDARTIEQGPLRDVALTGAFRKGIQSERVSYETAIGLARVLGHDDTAAQLAQSRDEEAAADADLSRLLEALLHEI